MRKAIDNQITEAQLEYLKSNEGRTILLCWAITLTPNEPHFYPDSPKCIDMRYAKRIRPSIFISEALIIGLLGGLMGLLFGWFVGFIVNTVVNKLASRFNGESLDLFMISDQFLWGLLVIALVLGLVTGLYPAFRASRLNPLNALRYE